MTASSTMSPWKRKNEMDNQTPVFAHKKRRTCCQLKLVLSTLDEPLILTNLIFFGNAMTPVATLALETIADSHPFLALN